jgi:hypothetical protein
MEGYITFTMGSGGSWIAWHTEAKPPKGATGRDLMSSPGTVRFAVGPDSDSALAKLKAEISSDLETKDHP